MRPAAALLHAFVAMALLVRLAVPAGFMPVADAHGRVTITLCAGTAPGAAMSHHMGGRQKHQPAEDHAKPCAFALLLAPALAPPSEAAAPMPLSADKPVLARRETVSAPGRGLSAPPPPATGPPILT